SALAEEIGDQFSIAMTTVQRGRILDDQGKFEESIPCFDRAIAVFEDLGARWELGDAIAERGTAKREIGRLDEAEDDLRKATRISEELGERQLASWTWRALAEVSERRGDKTEAEQRLRRSREGEARGPGRPGTRPPAVEPSGGRRGTPGRSPGWRRSASASRSR